MASSARQRIVFGMMGQAAKATLSLVASALLARWLEPSGYGTFIFVVGAINAIRQLFDLGTSTAYFTLAASTPRPAAFHRVYWGWLGVQLALMTLAISMLLPGDLYKGLFPSIPRPTATLAAVALFIQGNLWNAASQGAEASRQTARIQALGIVVTLAYLMAVVLLHLSGRLCTETVLALIAISWGIGCIAATRLRQHSKPTAPFAARYLGETFRLFTPHCLPLIPYAVLGAIAAFADRWMVQEWAGSQAQGEFGAAQQLGSLTLLVTVAMVPVLWKEIAESHHAGNREAALAKYARASDAMLITVAVPAGFVMPWTEEVVRLVLGPTYLGSGMLLALLVWYPVHQTLGQLQGAYFYATSRTAAYVTTGTVALVGGLVTSYALMAPQSAAPPGLGLGATGLAIRMLTVQFLTVSANELLLFGVRRGVKRLAIQSAIVTTCLALGWGCAQIGRAACQAPQLQALVAALSYTTLLSVVGYWTARGLGIASANPCDIVNGAAQRIRSIVRD